MIKIIVYLIDYFNLLSDELILSILKYLPRASLAAMAQVCRRLRALTYIKTLQIKKKHFFFCYLLVMIQVYGVVWICLENILKVVIYVMFFYVVQLYLKCFKQLFVYLYFLVLKFEIFCI